MSTVKQGSRQRNISEHDRLEWEQRVEELAANVTAWSQEQEWTITETQTVVPDAVYGTSELPMLTIEPPNGKLIFEPLPHALSGHGRISLYAWPTLYRVRLIQDNAQWTIMTDSGIPLRQPWNKETFLTLAQDLLGAE